MNFPSARALLLAFGVATLLPSVQAAPPPPDSAAMLKLADTSGCGQCHQLVSGAKGPDGKTAIGPAWNDVSAKYSGQANAENKLVSLVMSGTTPFDRHWKEKTGTIQMPANAKVINEADARLLVQWILKLQATK
jgi:cytochrome c